MARTGETWDEYEGSYVAVPWSEGRDILVRGTSRYLNFGTLVGTSGYGFRDNGGVMQFKNSGGSWTNFGTGGGGGTPGGSNTQVQFNDGGAFGGDAGLTYNKTTDTLTAVNVGADLITLEGGVNQDYDIKANGNNGLHIDGKQSGAVAEVDVSSADKDGTDNVAFKAFGVGDAAQANNERLAMGYNAAATDYRIHTVAQGTGTVRTLRIYTGSNTSQIVLNTDGTVSFGGNVTVPDETYNATTWNGSLEVPTKNAVRDELENKSNVGHTHTLANITDVTMTVANLNSLDDGVNSTLHFHDSDRSRANHTGTQTASTISDFAATVIATLLTGFTAAGTRTAILATDSILVSFGKVQKYFNDLATIAFSGALSDATGTINDTQHGTRAGGTLHANATTSVAGFMSAADKTKLDGVATGATANATDAALRDRATHTGTQAISTVSGLQTALDGKANTSHTHVIADTTGLQAALDGKANTSHGHSIADVTGLQTALDGKANTSHTHTASQITDFNTAADARIAAASVNALADVVVTSPTIGQVLKWNGTNWVNDTDAGGGGGITDAQARAIARRYSLALG